MAKKKKNSGSTTTAKIVKKGAAVAWICATVFVLVASGIVGAFGYGTQGFKDWGFSRFAPKGNVDVEQPVKTEQQSGGGMILGDSVSDCGAVLASYSLQRSEFAAYSLGDNIESSYVLYAKVLPEDATFDTVEYSADWVNGDSEWAQGKAVTDYITLSQGTYGNQNAATVSCKKEFREPVAITASYTYDPSIKATVQADYVGEVLYDCNASNGWYDDDNKIQCPRTINDGITFTYLGHTGTMAPNLEDCVAYRYQPNFVPYAPFKVYDGATKTSYTRNRLAVEENLNKIGIGTTMDYEDMDTEDQYVMGLWYTGTISFEDCEIGDEVYTPSYLEMMYAAVSCPTSLRAQMKSILSKWWVPDSSHIRDTEIWAGYFDYQDRKVFGSHIFYSESYMDLFSRDHVVDGDCYFGTTNGLIIYGNDVEFGEPGDMIFG